MLVSTLGHPDEMTISDEPLAADDHPGCGRYGLRVTVVIDEGLTMRTDGVLPGCMAIEDAEADALRALHADAARAGELPARVIYDCRRPFRGLTERGRRLLAGADDDSPLAERELELHEREVIAVELHARGLRRAWERVRRPLRRAA